MYTPYRSFGRILIALAYIYSSNAFANHSPMTLISFDFDTPTNDLELVAESLADNLLAQPWRISTGTISNFTGDPGRAMAGRGFAIENDFVLALTVAAGYSLDIDQIRFDQFASASGPARWQLLIEDAVILSGATADQFTTIVGNGNLFDLSGEVELLIRGTQASSNQGTFRIDNFSLTGALHAAPVPLPLPLGLFASALIPLMWQRR